MNNTSKEHNIIIAVGTNTRQEENLQKAKTLIKKKFKEVKFSSALWTQPIGINSDVFLNALASAKTSKNIKETTSVLKEIETNCGNTRAQRDKGIIIMDLDLMAFDEEKLHNNDWERTYIKALAKELR